MKEEAKDNVMRVKLLKKEMRMEKLASNLPSTADSSWQGYIMKLSKILSENNVSPEFRKMAAAKLHSALTSKDGGLLQLQYDYRWLSFNQSFRQNIKENILKSLDVETINPSPAALCVVSIAAAEFPNGQWPDLMNNLIKNIADGNSSDIVKEASFQTISYLCQELGKDGRQVLLSNSNAILKAILLGMKDANNDVVVAALNALENAADLFWANFEINSEKQLLLQMLFDVAESNDVKVKGALILCLKSLVSHHYDNLADSINPTFFDIAVGCLKSNSEDLRLKAIDFLKEICYVEDELRGKVKQNGQSIVHENRFYTLKSLTYLLPVFMDLLAKYVIIKDTTVGNSNETWNKFLGFLKELINCCSTCNVDQCLMGFIRENITNTDWRYRNAALTTFNAIIGDSRKNFEPLVLPLIQIMVEDENVEVRASAAHSISKMCANILQKGKYQEVLIPALLNGLGDDIKVAAVVCNAISYLAYTGKWNHPKYFVSVVHLLLEIITRSESYNRLQWEAAYTLHFIVGNNQTKCYFAAHKTALKIISILERLSVNNKCEEHLCILHITLETFFKRLPIKVASQICDLIMKSLSHIMKKDLNLLIEINLLPLVSTLVKNSGSMFKEYIDDFKLYLLAVLQRDKHPNIGAIRVMRDLCQVVGNKILPYCEKVVPFLTTSLLDANTNRAINKEILLAITFIVLAIGSNFYAYLQITIMALTGMQDRLESTSSAYCESSNLHQIIEMHKYLLKTYRALIYVFKSNEKVSADILKKLEPSLVKIIETIKKIMLKQHNQMEVYVPMCMEEIYDLSCIIDRKMINLIDCESIGLLLKLGVQSPLNETRSLTTLVNKKILFLKTSLQPEPVVQAERSTNNNSMFRRGLSFLFMICGLNLFGKTDRQ